MCIYRKLGFISNIYLERRIHFPKIKFPQTKYLALAGNIGIPRNKFLKPFLYQCKEKYSEVFYVPGPYEYRNKKLTKEETDEDLMKLCDTTGVKFLNRSCYDIPYHFTYKDSESTFKTETTKIQILGCTLWSNTDRKSKHFPSLAEHMLQHNKDHEWMKSALNDSTLDNTRTIVVSHFLPYRYLLPSMYLPNGNESAVTKRIMDEVNKYHYGISNPKDGERWDRRQIKKRDDMFYSDDYLDTSGTFYWIFGNSHQQGNAILGMASGSLLSYRQLYFHINSFMVDRMGK